MSGEEAKAVEAESVKSHENNVNENAVPAETTGTTESNVDETETKPDKHKDERSAKDQRGS